MVPTGRPRAAATSFSAFPYTTLFRSLAAHGEQRVEGAGTLPGNTHAGSALDDAGAATALTHDQPVIGQFVERPLGGDAGNAVVFRQLLFARQRPAGPELPVGDPLAHDQVDLVIQGRPEPSERSGLSRRTVSAAGAGLRTSLGTVGTGRA